MSLRFQSGLEPVETGPGLTFFFFFMAAALSSGEKREGPVCSTPEEYFGIGDMCGSYSKMLQAEA